MLNAVQDALVEYLETAQTAGRMPGLVTIQKGDAPVPTELLPAVTVQWDGKFKPKATGSHFEIAAQFELTLYAVSMESEATANAIADDLLCKAASPRWTGLLPVLAKLTGYTDDDGQGYKMKLVGDTIAGSLKSSGVYESIAIVTVEVLTWVDLAVF